MAFPVCCKLPEGSSLFARVVVRLTANGRDGGHNIMKHIIALLFLSPALASAQQPCTPAPCEIFTVTSGSMVFTGPGAEFTLAGPGFSATGVIDPQQNPLDELFEFYTGPRPLIIAGGTEGGSGFLSPIVNGVPWSTPLSGATLDGGNSYATFGADINPLPGPGTYTQAASFSGGFYGAPASVVSANPNLGCATGIACTNFYFAGSGTITFDAVPVTSGNVPPGAFQIQNATFSFGPSTGVPTPSTVALLSLGLAALGFQALVRTKRQSVL
jgi:hypothetical protein